jgi:hypothetical protein
MNQSFNFSRWRKLVSGHWVENRKRYLLAILAIGGLLAAWYSFMLVMDKHNPMNISTQFLTYHCGLYFVGCLYASSLFSELSNRAEGIHYLSVPASHLEKLLCALFFGVFLFFVAFTLVYYIVDIPMVHVANRINAQEGFKQRIGSFWSRPDEIFNAFSGKIAMGLDIRYDQFILVYLAIQSAFILGSVYFTRYAFIKTIVAVLLFAHVLLIFVNKGVAAHLPHGWYMHTLFSWQQEMDGADGTRMVRLSGWMEDGLGFLMQYSIPFIFWWITYIRLKEKEV